MTTLSETARERLRLVPEIRSVQVGDLKVSFVPDGFIKVKPRGLFPSTSEDDWRTHSAYLDDSGLLTAGHGGLLVERDERAVLIDAGFGPFSAPIPADHPVFVSMQGGSLLDGLAALGRGPGDVEAVAVTHLHVEHIGWAWYPVPNGEQTPTFPGADILISEAEWSQRRADFGVTDMMLDALAPRVRMVADGQEIFPGVRVLLTPGHTPGHTAYVIESGGESLIAFGDVLHSAVQVTNPDWNAAKEPDPESAARSRRRMLGRLGDTDTIGFGAHFADAVFGHVRQSARGLEWRPLP